MILRPVNVYGEGDCTSVTPRAIGTAVYAENKWDLKYLWTKSLKINTVHVMDVCAAIWTACTSVPAGKVYNLADDSDTDQGKLNGILGEIFGIVPDYAGSFVSNIARMGLATVADSINDTMVPAWATLCQEHNVLNTPLSPYVDTELLYNNDMCVDGSLICRETAFTYSHPTLEKKELERILESFIAQKIFPDILHKQNTAVPSMASLSIVDRKEI